MPEPESQTIQASPLPLIISRWDAFVIWFLGFGIWRPRKKS
jgi:hypothetical protein